jgi:hypothetical protein
MSPHFDPKPLNAFFQEIEELNRIKLKYVPENTEFPIQLENTTDGISRDKAMEVMQFIKGQVDLKENEICKIHTIHKGTKVIIEVTKMATQALAEVYSLSMFFDPEDE